MFLHSEKPIVLYFRLTGWGVKSKPDREVFEKGLNPDSQQAVYENLEVTERS